MATPSSARPKAKSVPSKPSSGVSTAMRRNVPTLRLESLALDAVGQRDGSLEVGRRPSPAADRRQRHPGRRARVSLAMIESLAAIELALVQPVKESGRERHGNNLVPAKSSQTLKEHSQPKAGARRHPAPRDPVSEVVSEHTRRSACVRAVVNL